MQSTRGVQLLSLGALAACLMLVLAACSGTDATATPLPTATRPPQPTATPVPPAATPAPPVATATALQPTPTATPRTAPTATQTAVPPAPTQAPPTATPAPAPDLTQFGFPPVAAPRPVQPNESATITVGSQSVTITPGSFANPVRFDFLTGDNAFWQRQLNDPTRTAIATFAFRVTDLTTSQLVGRPNNPLQWSFTAPRLSTAATVYAVSATTPPTLATLPPPPVLFSGQTLSSGLPLTIRGWFVTVPGAPVPTPTPAPAADMTKFGYATVAATRTIQPSEASTVTVGNQSVTVAAGSFTNPVRLDFLTGDNSFWQGQLNDGTQTVIATFALRVTDLTTSQLVGRPNNPFQYAITDPRLSQAAALYASTPATPPRLFKFPPAAFTFSGQTLSSSFSAALAGWFVTIPAASATPTPIPTAFQVNIANTTHANVTVPVGTTVVWTNKDTTQHTVTSGQNSQFDGKGWNSDPIDPGKTFSRAFTIVGTFTYTCRIHSSMNATVTVAQSGTPSASTPATGGGTDYTY